MMNVDQQAFKRSGLARPATRGLGEVEVQWQNVDDALNTSSAPVSTTPPKKTFLDVFNTVLTTGNTALQTYQNSRGGGQVAPTTPPPPAIPWVPIAIGGTALVAVALLLKSNKK